MYGDVFVAVSYDAETRKEFGMNVLGLVVFSVAVGVVVSQMGKMGRPIYLFTLSLAEATMKLVVVVIWWGYIQLYICIR